MNNIANEIGPALGAPAPFFTKAKSSGNWVILFSHPEELLPIFKTRTINYVLCKRRIKAVAIGNRRSPSATPGINFFEKYLVRHSLTFIEDADNRIAKEYGLEGADTDSLVKGVFVIDPKGHLRMKLYFPKDTVRDFPDILKLVDALQIADKQGKQKNSLHAAKVAKQNVMARPARLLP